jgi:hypothetical protein
VDLCFFLPINVAKWVVMEFRWDPCDIAWEHVKFLLSGGTKPEHPKFRFCKLV